MQTSLRVAIAWLAALPVALAAQQPATGGTISGRVLDQSGRPVANAEVIAFPAGARVRSDSGGRFALTHLDAGFYELRARHLGYLPGEMSTDLSRDGRVDVTLELRPRPLVLDSVIVLADGSCPPTGYEGFNCRKRFGKGVYLTDDDLADRGAVKLGDVFAGVKGFHTLPMQTPWGPEPIPYSDRASRCLNALVNGKPFDLTNPLPRYATELLAVEIYASPGDVPAEYSRYVWDRRLRETSNPAGGPHTAEGRCALVVYWTRFS